MKHRIPLLIQVLLCSMLLIGSHATADTVNVSAAVWGSARDAGRDGSFESLSFPNNIVLQRFTIPNAVDRGIWEFDLSELPGGSIVSVYLFFDLVSTTADYSAFELWSYAGDGSIDPSDAVAGTFLASLSPTASDYTIDVTSLITNAVNASVGYAGFNLRFTDDLSNVLAQKTFGDPGFENGDPWLIVETTTIPVPPAIWLLGSALPLLTWLKRR